MPKQKKYTDGDRVLIKYDENAYYMAVVTNVLAKSIDVVYDSDESEERVRIDSPRIFGSPVNNRRNANEIPEARAYKLCDIANPNARAPRSNGDATNTTAAPAALTDEDVGAVLDRKLCKVRTKKEKGGVQFHMTKALAELLRYHDLFPLQTNIGTARPKGKKGKFEYSSWEFRIEGKHTIAELTKRVEERLLDRYGTPIRRAWTALEGLAMQLEPEALSCDGEASRSHIAARKREINAEWKQHEKVLGCKVRVDQVWARMTTHNS